MSKEEIEKQAAESSPYFADSTNDKVYIEGFSDAGTRNLAKIQELEKKLEQERSHIKTCHLTMEQNNQRIKELESDNKFQEEVIISCGGNEIEKIELEKKLATAIEALEKIADTNNVGDFAGSAQDALAKIKGE